MSKAKQIARWSVIPLSVLLLLGMALAGCGSKSSSISDILKKSEDAGKNITSMRQEVQLIYEHPTYGTGTVQSRLIEISGSNVHVQEVVFGATIAEKILVSGRQFSKTYPDNKWVEESVSLNPTTSMPTDTSQYTNLVSNSQSQEQLANETVNGYDCYHLRFQLSPDNVKNMVAQVPQESLSGNTGGIVDIWIDQANNYMVKSEGLFKGVNITSLGSVNLTVAISRTSINQPITIVAPL